MEGVRIVLDASTKRTPERRKCSTAFEYLLEFAGTASATGREGAPPHLERISAPVTLADPTETLHPGSRVS